MTARRVSPHLAMAVVLMTITACGDSSPTPTTPSSGAQSFLTGTWNGTVTIRPNTGEQDPPAVTSGTATWTFEVVPQTNLQTFRATIHLDHSWLPITTVGTTAIVPGNTPPAQISTQGDYASPRGCKGTFGSFGTADATRISADFTGVDCSATFTGTIVLTKE
jgi:hypothetical protein